MSTLEVKVPDIGDFTDVPVIEVFVKPGDSVKADDSLITLESDKATMDVPSPSAGVVKDLKLKVGDKVSEGRAILTLETDGAGDQRAAPSKTPQTAASTAQSPTPSPKTAAPAQPEPATAAATTQEVKVPDIGDFKDVPVIEVFVMAGDTVKVDDPLVTLESDKATMDVPSTVAGTVKDVKLKVGDKVSEGTVIAMIESRRAAASKAAPAAQPAPSAEPPAPHPKTEAPRAAPQRAEPSAAPAPIDIQQFKAAHASPSVRVFARELGVDLSKVKGTGPKGRILREDVQQFVKQTLSAQPTAVPGAAVAAGGGLNLLAWPQVDFAKFGAIEAKPLSRIKKISGANLARNWVMIPHVTQFDDADITELEAFRVRLNKENEKSGIKVTMLAFLIKASVAALKKFPDFNASIDGDNLIYKKYFNIGFAADTPSGLVVPVIKNADQKGVLDIAKEMGELSSKAREGKLGPADMQGGCFSISSLGGIGGTAFTPIINAPEVAILGVSRSATKPVWDGKDFAPRLVLPLSLSYDHRVIDGAAAARFTTYFSQLLADMRRVML